MTTEERYFARIYLELLLRRSDGVAFEDVFTRIMDLRHTGFVQVKPQGSIGDRKNDGFIKEEGVYFQVYAPEDISANVAEAVRKAEGDFAGLKAHWDAIAPIKEFYFCYNDKYKGSFPTIEDALARLQSEHGLAKAGTLRCKDLANAVFELTDDAIYALVGHPPAPEKLAMLNLSVVDDIVKHVQGLELGVSSEGLLQAPDLDQKIAFNNLSQRVARLLRESVVHFGELEVYFANQDDFLRKDIREHFASLYAESKIAVDVGLAESNDKRFFYIINQASPRSDFEYASSLVVVMSYFFEACDIFESPSDAVA